MAKTVEIGPYSAYALAVAAGFVGTEEEWLKSLIGPQGEQGASITDVKINGEGHIIVTVHDPVSGEDSTIDAGDIGTVEAVEGVNAAIRQAAEQAVAAVTAQQATSVGAVQAAQSTGVQAVQQAQSTATGVVRDAQTSAVQAVNSARDKALSQVETSTKAAEQAKDAAASSAAAAAESATDAAASKTAAATSATQAAEAKTGADSAKAAAETAQQAAESAKDSAEVAQSKAEQAETNAQSAAGEIDAGLIVESASGEVISVSDSANVKLRGLHLYGKSVQNGVPTPEAPVEIESVMNPTVVVAPKNLIDYAEWNKVSIIHGTGIWRDFGIVITSDGNGDAYTGFTNDKYEINVVPGITYKLSWEHTGSNGSVYIFPNGSSTGMVQITTNVGSSLSYTTKEGDSFITIRVGVRDANATATYKNVMLSIDSDTTFVPYSGDAKTLTYPTPNGLPGIPVESGGNYTDKDGQQWVCDEVDFGRGKYVQRVKKEELTGTPNFNVTDGIYTERFWWGSCLTNTYKDGSNSSLSTFASYQRWSTGTSNHPIFAVSEKSVYFKPTASISKEEVNRLFTQMIASENPPYIVGQLETPIETDLTPEQLTAYAALTTYKPNTTVTTDSSPAAGIEVNYVADTKTYIDNKLAAISEAILGGKTNGDV